MLGELLTKILVMLFGFVIPAFECFKIVEQRPAHIEQLRFWCQYWIIVAIVTVLGDNFASWWLPMYGELKLAFFVYLWYPKTMGSDLIYDTFLKPLVVQYEPDIEQRLWNLRARAGQLIVFYIRNFTDKGTELFLETLNYVIGRRSRTPIVEENRRQGLQPAAMIQELLEPNFPEPRVDDPRGRQRRQQQHRR